MRIVVCLFMAAVLSFGMLPSTAFAADEDSSGKGTGSQFLQSSTGELLGFGELGENPQAVEHLSREFEQSMSLLASEWVVLAEGTYQQVRKAGYTDHDYEKHMWTSYWRSFAGHNCTNYVGYMLTKNGNAGHGALMGNANEWASSAKKLGYPVNGTPAVGSVAQWNSMHVAYVEEVGNGYIVISEDNYSSGPFRWRKIYQGTRNWPDNFLHIADIKSGPTAFHDVNAHIAAKDGSDWYVTEGWLNYVLSKGIMNGYTDGSNCFGPYDSITRGQVATILFRCSNPKSKATTEAGSFAKTGNFSDVEGGQYYTAAINWCKEKSIITGYESTGYKTFGPDEPVTREELATMIARYAGWESTGKANIPEASDSEMRKRPDYSSVSDWARQGMAWCTAKGIVRGINGDTLAPKDNAWRASMAKMITVTVRDVLKR